MQSKNIEKTDMKNATLLTWLVVLRPQTIQIQVNTALERLTSFNQFPDVLVSWISRINLDWHDLCVKHHQSSQSDYVSHVRFFDVVFIYIKCWYRTIRRKESFQMTYPRN